MHSEHVYYNINIPWDENKPDNQCVAEVLYDSQETVLDRGSDYYASIINFNIPVSSIPIFFVDPEPFPNTDVNLTRYKVALEYEGEVSSATVIYNPSDLLQPLPAPPSASLPDGQRTAYYAVYTYNHFIQMVNRAFAQAHADLVTKPAGTKPPTLYWDGASNRFELQVDSGNYVSTLPQPINVYMGYYLFQFFEGFDTYKTGFQTADGRDHKFHIISNNNVVDGVLTMPQDYPTVANWNCLRTIQLRGGMLNTADEYVPSVNSGSDGRASKAPILASFNPIYSNGVGGTVARSQISYTLESAHRLIDILTSASLTKISMAIWWTDEKNNEYRLRLNYRELIQVKLCFHLRATFRG